MGTYLITGASRGIGLEMCRQVKERGHEVIAVCRTTTPELASLGVRVETGVDVASDQDMADLAASLQDVRIDVLVNNAGIFLNERLDRLDLDSIRQQFEVNSLGPLRVTRALLDRLAPGAKVIIITSRMGSIADNSSGGYYGYRMSKAAVNMAGMSLARDLAPRGIAVALLHPGLVRTDMTDGHGHVDPPEAVRGLLARIDSLSLAATGSFWHASGEALPW